MLQTKVVPASKIAYIPNASHFVLSDQLLNTFNATTFRKECGLEERFAITYVGAYGVVNHLGQVLDAARVLHPKHPEVLFLLIGEGMEKAKLKAAAVEECILDTAIQFVDAVPKAEVFKYILASNLGASILKKNDTFKTVYSNKIFDYMACKKPVLMLIDGVSRELVEEAGCGKYVSPEDTDAFVTAIESYLKYTTAELQAQGERGYQYAKAHFDRAVLAKAYLDVLHSIINSKKN